MNSLQQQARFDDFVQEFSTEPPHEALAMNRVAEAVGRAMHDFGDHGKRANSACSKARNEQELREIERRHSAAAAELPCRRRVTISSTLTS
jgi:hypothetical protein